jgi:hypothetical protein
MCGKDAYCQKSCSGPWQSIREICGVRAGFFVALDLVALDRSKNNAVKVRRESRGEIIPCGRLTRAVRPDQ